MFLVWNPELHSLNIPVIDSQHGEFFILTNQLHDLIMNNASDNNQLQGILKRLYAYSNFHFASEEGMFSEYAYPEKDEHQKIHKAFKIKMKEHLKEIKMNPNLPLLPLQDYLVEWILKHIQGEDKKYEDFFQQNNIKPEIHFSISEQNRNDVLSLWQQKKMQLEIKEIDNQHRELVNILQQTNDLQFTSEKRKMLFLPVIIKKLFYYSQYHFSYEEELMAKSNYPSLKEQQDMHRGFIKKIVTFANDYKKDVSSLTDEIIIYLKDWTIRHIISEDNKYKNKLNY